MINTCEVYLWGTRVGIIHKDPEKSYASFEYDSDFIKTDIEISPLMMPLSNTVYEFPLLVGEPFFGLPGLVADSLPDDFGNKVIENWLTLQGKSINDFSAVDRLCYTGTRGMGALEYVPSTFGFKEINEDINVTEMVKFASQILKNRQDFVLDAGKSVTYSQLVQVGSSAGGARAKALIAWNEKTDEIRSGQLDLDADFDYWLMKFDNVAHNGDHGIEDAVQYTLIEYAYYKMAVDAGVNMSECRIFRNNGENHFLTKRFDRVNGRKLHMQSLGAIAHLSYKEPKLCGYEQAVHYMSALHLPFVDIEQFYNRMVFNCLALNQDDHVKNTSFLMDRTGVWRLSPAYDVTFAYNPSNRWIKSHQMTVNGKSDGITLHDLIESGNIMGLKRQKCLEIIDRTKAVVSKFELYASDVGIKNKTAEEIIKVLNSSVLS